MKSMFSRDLEKNRVKVHIKHVAKQHQGYSTDFPKKQMPLSAYLPLMVKIKKEVQCTQTTQ